MLGRTVFRLSEIAFPTVLLRTPDDVQHVLFRDGARSLQLSIEGADVTLAVRLMTNVLVDPAHLAARQRALACLNHLQIAGHLSAKFYPSEPRERRLNLVLRALDGSLVGMPHRAIAIALFGRGRVADDWTDPGNHLRDQVRRAVARGTALMNGGYRQLLL